MLEELLLDGPLRKLLLEDGLALETLNERLAGNTGVPVLGNTDVPKGAALWSSRRGCSLGVDVDTSCRLGVRIDAGGTTCPAGIARPPLVTVTGDGNFPLG